jgi:hypothetical protein
MHDRRQRWLPAELVATWHSPVVCIQRTDPLRTRRNHVSDLAIDFRSWMILAEEIADSAGDHIGKWWIFIEARERARPIRRRREDKISRTSGD